MLLEKAKEYANDCLSEKEITTFEVKKQCEWFLEDLEKQNNDYYPYYFDTKKINIIEGILKLLNFATGLNKEGENLKGTPIYEGLENFQAFFLANIFGWRHKTDANQFRYREVDLFIPRKNAKMGYIIYAPLQNVAFFGNKKTAELVNRYTQGNEISEEDRHTAVWRYLSEIMDIHVTLPKSKTVGSETCIVIILSQSCNLACTYCYAQEARSKKTLDKGKLRIAIDFALSKSSKTVDFIFIGGGEPLLNWGLLKYAIDYIFDARKKSTQINITVTTNATLLNDERINYLKEHGVYLGISYDILPRVQNIQRPFADMNHNSFDVVDAMIKKVDDAGILYNFRSTITKLNVNLMPEMVDFVKSNYKNVNKLHFEPVLSVEDNDEDLVVFQTVCLE